MLRNYLKVALRNLFKHKTYSFINIFGLALGMASAILILLFVRYERSYDRFHKNADRIQRVAVRAIIGNTKIRQTSTPAILTPTLLEHFPEVERSIRFHDSFEGVTVKHDDLVFNEYWVGSTDADFFKVFTFPLKAGDPDTALQDPNTVVISETIAQKYFKGREALNRTLNIDGLDFRVSGVMTDFPDNSHFHFDMLRSLNTYKDRI
jgi:putative ABC transport system permease protein